MDTAAPESALHEAPARSIPVEPPSPRRAVELQEPAGPVVPAGGAFIGSPAPEPPLPEPPRPEPPPVVEPEPADGNGYLASYLADNTRLAAASGVEHGLHGAGATLIVSDLERSLRFYRDVVGLTEIDSGVGSAVLASGDIVTVRRQDGGWPRVTVVRTAAEELASPER